MFSHVMGSVAMYVHARGFFVWDVGMWGMVGLLQ